MKKWLACILVLAGIPIQAADWRDAKAVVYRLQNHYNKVQSFSADFRQIFSSRGFRSEESGVVRMKKPGKMYWEYRSPRKKFFVADGRKAYFYVPRDKQVMVSDLDLQSGDTPLLFLLGKGNLLQDFEIVFESGESSLVPGNQLLRLTPKVPQGEYSHLLLEIEPQTDRIHRLTVVEPIGNRNDYILTNFKENVRISEAQFRLDWPADVEVIRQ